MSAVQSILQPKERQKITDLNFSYRPEILVEAGWKTFAVGYSLALLLELKAYGNY